MEGTHVSAITCHDIYLRFPRLISNNHFPFFCTHIYTIL